MGCFLPQCQSIMSRKNTNYHDQPKMTLKRKSVQLLGRLHFCKGRTVFVGNGILLAYVRDTEIGLWTCLPNHEDYDSDFMRGLFDFEELYGFIDFSWGQVFEGQCREGFFIVA